MEQGPSPWREPYSALTWGPVCVVPVTFCMANTDKYISGPTDGTLLTISQCAASAGQQFDYTDSNALQIVGTGECLGSRQGWSLTSWLVLQGNALTCVEGP